MANESVVSLSDGDEKNNFKGFATVYNPHAPGGENMKRVLDETDLQINHYHQRIPHFDASVD